ncbi:MAG: FKBP-type peptidyl-prolyl cis-trans isomerase [Parasphingorhabdus sp.]|uniref:FKBP-type peptidyl-prolyl cis-trans isomerase n=1 Tax=Parasphingorhabdus sp. TaxID=2709688 RepID=UPI0032670958
MGNDRSQLDIDRPSLPIKPFGFGLLFGVILMAVLAAAIPEKTSPTEFAQAGWEKFFPPPGNAEFLIENGKQADVVTTQSGLQYKVIKPGEGDSPTATDTALVKYEGTLRDGTVFDANEQTPMPVGGVVPGFSEALQLMQKGGEYRLWIPSDLAYGEASPGENVPPNSLLIFDVTLLDFITAEQMEELRQQMQAQGVSGGPPPAP